MSARSRHADDTPSGPPMMKHKIAAVALPIGQGGCQFLSWSIVCRARRAIRPARSEPSLLQGSVHPPPHRTLLTCHSCRVAQLRWIKTKFPLARIIGQCKYRMLRPPRMADDHRRRASRICTAYPSVASNDRRLNPATRVSPGYRTHELWASMTCTNASCKSSNTHSPPSSPSTCQ